MPNKITDICENRVKYRSECVRWISEFNPDLFVTFAFNRSISMDRAQKMFEDFHLQLDQKLIGRAVLRHPERRTDYIATIEKPTRNLHIHALFCMTTEQKAKFPEIAQAIWKKLCAAGNLDIKPVHYAEGAARYITKELRADTSDRLLLPPHKEKKPSII